MHLATAAQATFLCVQPYHTHTCILTHQTSHTRSHPGSGPSSSPAILPLPSVFNQLALALGFIRGLRKLGFSLEFIKAEWSWACCLPQPRAWAPCPHLEATTPCPSAGCLWAPSQEAPRRKLGG